MKTIITLLIVVLFNIDINAQGVIQNTLPNQSSQCGSYHFMEHINNKEASFIKLSNDLVKDAQHVAQNPSRDISTEDVLVVPVVFHVVYNNEEENIPDSVIHNQIEILNKCFRRQNEDAVNTRPEFLNLVGDAKIEFELAEIDPDGNLTTGITRTNTSITHFGGVLPYATGQNQKIATWISDSLYYNLFRLSDENLGGHNAWDVDEYLNVWIGDLRILEPKVNNFEEILFMALGTPPVNHQNWPVEMVDFLKGFAEGILIHYVNIGPNNPAKYPAPYHAYYDGVTNKGKTLVHEVGHYLGLRHIWGDGYCDEDDFVKDTPRAKSASAFNCSHTINSCKDTIDGVDLHNMVENYMDYSSSDCQNAFTKGQADVMRNVLDLYRSSIYTVEVGENSFGKEISYYPNPTRGVVKLNLNKDYKTIVINVFDVQGKLVQEMKKENNGEIRFNIEGPKGFYFVEVNSKQNKMVLKVVKN